MKIQISFPHSIPPPGAQLKAVCVEAGMEALRRGATELFHEDYVVGIFQVQAKKKSSLNYYA
jgi:26S proteasome regulatory subunit T5